MPVINRLADLAPAIAAWRRDIHAHPELLFDTHRTSALVADRLRAMGCDEVATGLGRTGVVGVIRGRDASSGKVIGLRADMDALPIIEATKPRDVFADPFSDEGGDLRPLLLVLDDRSDDPVVREQGGTLKAAAARIHWRSPPAQNEGPRPPITNTRTSSTVPRSKSVLRSSVTMSPSKALRTSGRLSQTRATGPSICTSRRSSVTRPLRNEAAASMAQDDDRAGR